MISASSVQLFHKTKQRKKINKKIENKDNKKVDFLKRRGAYMEIAAPREDVSEYRKLE
jgi:hypothetical protein